MTTSLTAPSTSNGALPSNCSLEGDANDILDVLGVGFGPSNLALAIAIDEHNTASHEQLRSVFFEKQPRFGWHRGMLIDDSTMQVSFMKDLVSMRNPTSHFSFVCYLHHRGRLVDFINHKILFPLRTEFHDYLEWAAHRMADLVSYSSEVIDVRPVTENGIVTSFDVVVRADDRPTGELVVHRTRNVVVAVGLEMCLPPGVQLADRVWHNLNLLDRLGNVPDAPPPRRFLVLGAGQSAPEVVEYLHRRFRESEVCSVFARYGYTPADDSPFANRIFDPEAVDVYFGAPRHIKQMLFDYHRNTNYSVVDQDLIDELYRRVYQERVQGRERLRILNASRLVEVLGRPGGVDATVEHLPTGEHTTLGCDAVIYATGYQPAGVACLLGTAADLCRRDDEGTVCVERDYRVVTTSPAQGGIYLQGATEHTHGIGSSLLSNVAVRTGEIVHSVAQRRIASEESLHSVASARR